MSSITTENIKYSITTALNTDARSGTFIPNIIPNLIPGGFNHTQLVMTIENLKTSITTECNG
jgi:hypothetical protein